MTKALTKSNMKRSELESEFVKNKTNENLKSYKNKEISAANYIKKKQKNMKG